MFKTGLSSLLYQEFIDSFDNLTPPSYSSKSETPYFYADRNGVKYITSLINEGENVEDEVFATSVGEDGWIEVLSL